MKSNGVGLVFPLMINARFGEGTSKLDMGLGQGVTITTKGAFFMLTTAAVGYRYQKETSPWYFKASYTLSAWNKYVLSKTGGFTPRDYYRRNTAHSLFPPLESLKKTGLNLLNFLATLFPKRLFRRL